MGPFFCILELACPFVCRVDMYIIDKPIICHITAAAAAAMVNGWWFAFEYMVLPSVQNWKQQPVRKVPFLTVFFGRVRILLFSLAESEPEGIWRSHASASDFYWASPRIWPSISFHPLSMDPLSENSSGHNVWKWLVLAQWKGVNESVGCEKKLSASFTLWETYIWTSLKWKVKVILWSFQLSESFLSRGVLRIRKTIASLSLCESIINHSNGNWRHFSMVEHQLESRVSSTKWLETGDETYSCDC